MPVKPKPLVTIVDSPYWDGCANGELRIQECNDCGHVWLPAASVCPRCLSDSHSWRAASGRGYVWSWIRMHQVYLESFRQDVPYNVALVRLEEGPMLLSNVILPEGVDPSCDMVVRVTFPQDDPVPLPRFEAMGS